MHSAASVAISGHHFTGLQRPSEAFRGLPLGRVVQLASRERAINLMQSEAIRGLQRLSGVICGQHLASLARLFDLDPALHLLALLLRCHLLTCLRHLPLELELRRTQLRLHSARGDEQGGSGDGGFGEQGAGWGPKEGALWWVALTRSTARWAHSCLFRNSSLRRLSRAVSRMASESCWSVCEVCSVGDRELPATRPSRDLRSVLRAERAVLCRMWSSSSIELRSAFRLSASLHANFSPLSILSTSRSSMTAADWMRRPHFACMRSITSSYPGRRFSLRSNSTEPQSVPLNKVGLVGRGKVAFRLVTDMWAVWLPGPRYKFRLRRRGSHTKPTKKFSTPD